MEAQHTSSDRLVTDETLAGLPTPVQRYLRATGVVGRPVIHTARLRQAGRFRRGTDQPWMPMSAEQFYTTDPPAFVWNARFRVAGLPLMRARDTYKGAHGHMYARLAGVLPIFDVRGEELDQGTMIRYLNEMCWFPTAFLGPNVTWRAVDDHCAEVTFADSGKSVSAQMSFDDAGRVTNFTTLRYRENQGRFTLDPWSTPMTEYGMRGGLNLPVRGQAVWNLPAGDLVYAELAITEVEYNAPLPADVARRLG